VDVDGDRRGFDQDSLKVDRTRKSPARANTITGTAGDFALIHVEPTHRMRWE
jgi:hypothetical protein